MRLANNGNLLFRPAVGGYIPIGSYAEFRLIDTNSTTRGGTYKQEADLDLMSVSWTPIHASQFGTGFTGTFDGNGYAINNLLVNTQYAGLFSYSTGTIKNVRIASGSVTGQNLAAGVVVYNNGGTIIASYNTGAVTATGNYSFVGGVVGYGSATASSSADGTTNQYWKDLGGWNGGSPTYPKLWWE
ncbi:hypothetical protein FACS189432_01920 [Bacteroidia bacterium]|nr:hypothetical protein FACS189432_01920 [Bacteroidia bacterium]GHV71834.1 hypothetical protein FACS189420_8110 [Bacteroidia bacterium]